MKNVLDLLQGKGISPKKAAAAKGGEYHSPCPGCGGDDRFHVWPEQNNGQGSYWCRQCGKKGDRIQFLRDFDGLGFAAACRALDVVLPEKERFRTPRVKTKVAGGAAAGWQPAAGAAPAEIWREKADKLVAWAHAKLLENKTEMRRLLARGITKKLAEQYRLGWIPEDMWRHRKSWGLTDEFKKNGKAKRMWIPQGLVIPLIRDGHALRIRIRRPAGEPRYYALPGSNMDCLVLSAAHKTRLAVVVESELDAILLVRFAADLAAMIALGNSSRKPDAAASEKLAAADLILLAVDYDAGGNNQVAWWREHFVRTKHWPVPRGKDPGDAYKDGVDLRAWVVAGCPAGWQAPASLLGAHPAPPAESEAAAVPAVETAMGGKRDVPAGVLELQALLENTPVVIENTPERTSILAPQRWSDRNWEVSREISRLVYFEPPVFDWIVNHPEHKITAENLLK